MAVATVNNALGGTRQNLSSTFKTLVSLFVSASLRRCAVHEFSVGAADVPNPTDCNIEWDVSRMTADGTGTSVTPQFNAPLETGSISGPLTTSKANYTVEPTVTANSQQDSNAMNQRATWRWVAVTGPGGPDCLWTPGVQNNGLVLRAKSPNYASVAAGQMKFTE